MIPIKNILFALWILYAAQLHAQRTASHFPGEELSYKIEFLNLRAGSMDFRIHDIERMDSTDVYHLSVRAETNSLFSPLFGIQNNYESYFDTSDFMPRLFKKNVRQKNIQQEATIWYDYGEKKAFMSDSIFWAIPTPCLNFFSMLYFLRNQRYDYGDTLWFHMDSENLPSLSSATIVDRKEISTPAGKFPAEGVQLIFTALGTSTRPWKTDLLTNRLANPGSIMTIWLSTDERRLPVRIEFMQKQFNVRLVLLKAGNDRSREE